MKYSRLDPNSLSVMQRLSKQLCAVTNALLEDSSKMSRIQGSADYTRALTYHGTGTDNVISIVHTGTTSNGTETITETFTYVDPAINGSNVTNIAYS
jgi:hypothetical protein